MTTTRWELGAGEGVLSVLGAGERVGCGWVVAAAALGEEGGGGQDVRKMVDGEELGSRRVPAAVEDSTIRQCPSRSHAAATWHNITVPYHATPCRPPPLPRRPSLGGTL